MRTSTPRSSRRRARKARAASASAVLACLLAVAPLPAAAAPVLPATVASTDDETDSPGAEGLPPFSMTPADRGVVSGDRVIVQLRFANDGAQTVPASTVSLSVGDELSSSDAVESWLSGSGATGFSEVASVPTAPLAAGAVETVDESIEISDMPPGVYPLRGEFSGSSSADVARSVLVVTGDERPQIGLVLPVTGPVAEEGLYSAETLTTLTSESGLLEAQLDAATGTNAILAVDPAIPAAIRALGASAPESAVAWLDRLMSMPNDRFALQFADADVTAQVDAGLDEKLSVPDLDAYLQTYAPLETEQTDPAEPAPEEDEPPVPTVDELLAVSPDETTRILWPAPGTADDETVAALADDGRRVLVPSSSTADGRPALGESVLAYDDGLSDALVEAAHESDPSARETALIEATADIWLAAERAGGPLLLALDRLGSDELETDEAGLMAPATTLDISGEGLRDAVLASLRSPAFTAATLDEIVDAGSGSVSLVDAQPDEQRAQAVRTYLDNADDLAHTATALENPDLLTSQTRAELLRLLQVGWTTNPEGWQQRADRFASQQAARIDAIDIQDPQPVQLLSPEADMPVWIRNDLPYEARVVIEATPDDPRLSIEERTEVVAPPLSTTRFAVPIEARVGSGEVSVHLALRAVTGERIGPLRDMDVTVRADWERIGIVAMAVLVVGLLALGTVRQIRRRRREHAAREADGAGVEPEVAE